MCAVDPPRKNHTFEYFQEYLRKDKIQETKILAKLVRFNCMYYEMLNMLVWNFFLYTLFLYKNGVFLSEPQYS